MGKNFTSKLKTERILKLIIRILETRDEPLSAAEISFIVESQTRYRCSVFAVGQILRPLVTDLRISKLKMKGSNKKTYRLIN